MIKLSLKGHVKMVLSGSIVANITPFLNGCIDESALRRLVDFHVKAGTTAMIPCGTTGEGVLLSRQEWQQVIKICIEESSGRLPIIPGCSAASTSDTIELIKCAKDLGATAALVMAPFYVKPTPEGIYRHFQAIYEACDLPLILYNNQGRAVIDLSVDTIVNLADIPNIIALKDCNTDLTRLIHLRRRITKPFSFLSGEDTTAAAYLAYGGDGVISISANVVPQQIQQMCKAWKEKDVETFEKRRDQLATLFECMLLEVNPAPIKYAVSQLGLCRNELRLPLIPVSEKTQKLIQKELDYVLEKPIAA